MKRTIVWVDDADKDSAQVRVQLKEYLDKAGLKYTIFEVLEVIDSDIGCNSK